MKGEEIVEDSIPGMFPMLSKDDYSSGSEGSSSSSSSNTSGEGGGGGSSSLATTTTTTSEGKGGGGGGGSGLSRRQRKNHRKKRSVPKDKGQSDVNKTSSSISSSNSSCNGSPQTFKKKSRPQCDYYERSYPPLRQYMKLGGMSDRDLYFWLLNYLLTRDELRKLGYPIESELFPGKAIFYKDNVFGSLPFQIRRNLLENNDSDSSSSSSSSTSLKRSHLNVTAKEFVPTTLKPEDDDEEKKYCVRCSRAFHLSDYLDSSSDQKCVYHYGKLRSVSKTPSYTCCGRYNSSNGCTKARYHVWRGNSEEGVSVPLDGYVKTRPPSKRRTYGDVYSLDCEMCYTSQGMEVVKVAVVGLDGRRIYDSLVQPENAIVDYNTRFSGISSYDLKRGPTKTLKEVQNDMLSFIDETTILIGHGLENDLRSLKIIHSTIIDTSVVYPHYYGLPFRRSLKSLVKCYLKRQIQVGDNGHDPYEDARGCAELMLWKIRKDLNAKQNNKNIISLLKWNNKR